jgi:hypothetical protein
MGSNPVRDTFTAPKEFFGQRKGDKEFTQRYKKNLPCGRFNNLNSSSVLRTKLQ